MITGKIIRQLRNARGIGIRELEKLTGINRGNLSKIERGSGFGPLQIKRIAVQLDTTPAVIFILTEILADRTDILDDIEQISGLCINLTRLMRAYVHSPFLMQKMIDEMLPLNFASEVTG